MNKNMVCCILLITATSQPLLITAHELSPAQTTQTIEQKNTILEHDELDMVYEQQGENMQYATASPQIPDWIVSFAIGVLLKYFAFKDFMTTSWHTLKERIIRKKKSDDLNEYAKN